MNRDMELLTKLKEEIEDAMIEKNDNLLYASVQELMKITVTEDMLKKSELEELIKESIIESEEAFIREHYCLQSLYRDLIDKWVKEMKSKSTSSICLSKVGREELKNETAVDLEYNSSDCDKQDKQLKCSDDEENMINNSCIHNEFKDKEKTEKNVYNICNENSKSSHKNLECDRVDEIGKECPEEGMKEIHLPLPIDIKRNNKSIVNIKNGKICDKEVSKTKEDTYKNRLYTVVWYEKLIWPCLIMDIKDIPEETKREFENNKSEDKIVIRRFNDEDDEHAFIITDSSQLSPFNNITNYKNMERIKMDENLGFAYATAYYASRFEKEERKKYLFETEIGCCKCLKYDPDDDDDETVNRIYCDICCLPYHYSCCGVDKNILKNTKIKDISYICEICKKYYRERKEAEVVNEDTTHTSQRGKKRKISEPISEEEENKKAKLSDNYKKFKTNLNKIKTKGSTDVSELEKFLEEYWCCFSKKKYINLTYNKLKEILNSELNDDLKKKLKIYLTDYSHKHDTPSILKMVDKLTRNY